MLKIRILVCLALLASVGAAAAGCNTTEGFGKDIESSGKAIKGAAE
jgi:predicted small secreted protein